MNKDLLYRANQFSKEIQKKRRRKRIISLLSVFVVLATLNTLRLPAITMAQQTICGKEEHIHNDECYSDVTAPEYFGLSEIHLHNENCYVDGVLSCNNSYTYIHSHNEYCYDSTAALVCPLEEVVEHSHSDLCYVSQKNLLCTLEEDYHIHDDGCFAIENGNLICTVEETEGHLHSDECYHTISTDLICQTEETEGHIHSEECYRISTENICRLVETEGHKHTEQCKSIEYILNCEIAEDENHTHNEECYTANEILICTLEETEPHTHTEQCTRQFKELVCEKEEIPAHTHSTECYQDNKELICGNEEIQPHTHNTDCYQQVKTVICEKEEKPDGHIHTERCYEEIKNLICTEKEIILHSHTAECYSENGELTCGLEEVKEHIHSENCTKFVQQEEKALVCTLEEHAHTDECYPPEPDDGRQLICIREEHIHTESCGDTCEIQEHKHTDDCYIAADIEKEEVSTENTPHLDIELYDISNGPVFIVDILDDYIQETDTAAQISDESVMLQKMKSFSTRVTQRNIVDLENYVATNNGEIKLSLVTFDDKEIPKDENGNYLVNTADSYKLALKIDLPNGILPGAYRYKLPDGVVLDGAAGPLSVTVDNINVVLGEWEVSENGYIVLNFNENSNSYTHVAVSAAIAISFDESKDYIDFDGIIKVKIEPPEEIKEPTEIKKLVHRGNPNDNEDPNKLYWQIVVEGKKHSFIPGNFLVDSITSDTHSYTEEDMQKGITIGVSQPDPVTGEQKIWHTWTIHPGDDGLIWNEDGWHYTIPKKCGCHCDTLLGNDNWIYYFNYTSTPDITSINSILGYRNKASIDDVEAEGEIYFNQNTSQADIVKNGVFTSDSGEGKFVWTIYATIPGVEEGTSVLAWFINDMMYIRGENGIVDYPINSLDSADVYVVYDNNTEVKLKLRSEATEEDRFCYDFGEKYSNNGSGILNSQAIYLYCRCNCTEENCQYWDAEENRCGSKETWVNRLFCRCWTEQEDVTFKIIYSTTQKDKENLFDDRDGKNYTVANDAILAHLEKWDGTKEPIVEVDSDYDNVGIPGIFKKELTNKYEGYTAHYKITVNEAKLDLTNGEPLIIHDAMTDTLAYVNGSLWITAEDAAGNTTTLTEGIDYSVTYDGSGNHVDTEGNKKHVLDIKIYNPQPVKYTLDYEATLIFPKNSTDDVTYTNSATIQLWNDSITSDSDKIVYTGVHMVAQRYSVKIQKTSASTDAPLKDARFGLYSQHGGLMAAESTTEDGEILFETNVTEGIVLSEHELYYIQEIAAPEGYVLDDTKHWFCFCKCEGECEFKPEVDFTFDRVPEDQMVYNLRNSTYGYELPETGGAGTQQYTAGGLFLILSAVALLFYRSKKCRKEDITSS